jgi:hypothetical protein
MPILLAAPRPTAAEDGVVTVVPLEGVDQV